MTRLAVMLYRVSKTIPSRAPLTLQVLAPAFHKLRLMIVGVSVLMVHLMVLVFRPTTLKVVAMYLVSVRTVFSALTGRLFAARERSAAEAQPIRLSRVLSARSILALIPGTYVYPKFAFHPVPELGTAVYVVRVNVTRLIRAAQIIVLVGHSTNLIAFANHAAIATVVALRAAAILLGKEKVVTLVVFAVMTDVVTRRVLRYASSFKINYFIKYMSERPHNINAIHLARDVQRNFTENIQLMPAEFDMYPFVLASYVSLCTGCTDPRAYNYDPLAEIDDNSCL